MIRLIKDQHLDRRKINCPVAQMVQQTPGTGDDNIDAGCTYENIDRILIAAGADMDNVYRAAAFDYAAR